MSVGVQGGASAAWGSMVGEALLRVMAPHAVGDAPNDASLLGH